MCFNDNADPEFLNGVLLGVLNKGHAPCSTKAYLEYSPNMTIEQTGVEGATEDELTVVENVIDSEYRVLVANSRQKPASN